MKHPLVGVCRLVVEGGNQSQRAVKRTRWSPSCINVSCFVLRMRERLSEDSGARPTVSILSIRQLLEIVASVRESNKRKVP